MKDFYCTCGQRIYFDNIECLACGRQLRFDPEQHTMVALTPGGEGAAPGGEAWLVDPAGRRFRDCRNRAQYRACNWVLPEDDPQPYCRSCRLNKVVPHLERAGNVRHWSKLESAKRHLLYTLIQLGLPVQGSKETGGLGLEFAFLEDNRSNANVRESFVATGHARGLITLNLAEADDAYREKTRQQLGEIYRTILGHFRHESGHYYYELLVRGSDWQSEFVEVFGDPDINYQRALKHHYAKGRTNDWQQHFISAYASSHPSEDWAETWAHYLHMRDTLETASAFGLRVNVPTSTREIPLQALVDQWVELTVVLNALNRSMGLADAYPFVLTETVVTKLRMIHQVIQGASQ